MILGFLKPQGGSLLCPPLKGGSRGATGVLHKTVPLTLVPHSSGKGDKGGFRFLPPQEWQEGNEEWQELLQYSIWYIPQFSSITQSFPISIRDIVASGLITGWNFLKKTDTQKVNDMLSFLNLENLADKLISEVSGGERQRALIARALVKNPDIIIADEPTSNIDIHREKEIFNIFEQLHLQGKTLLVVSHDVFLLKKYATIVFDVNKHLHTHQPEEITEKLIYESYICPECHGEQ